FKDGQMILMRVPYPMGFYAKGLDGRIDDPSVGWKGRGLWSSSGDRTPWLNELGKGARPRAGHIQGRPDPLAHSSDLESGRDVRPALSRQRRAVSFFNGASTVVAVTRERVTDKNGASRRSPDRCPRPGRRSGSAAGNSFHLRRWSSLVQAPRSSSVQ